MTRLRKFEEAGPPEERPPAQRSRCGCAARARASARSSCERLELTGLMKPFDLEVWYGDRVAVLGSNGSGKSHFLRLLAGGGTEPDRTLGHVTTVGRDARRECRTTGARCSARASCPDGSRRTTSIPSSAGARCSTSCTAATRTATAWRARRRARRSTATGSRLPRSSGSSRSRAASRRACRSCCSSSRASRCCCSTSRPTTSTSSRPRRSRTRSSRFDGTVLAVTHDRWFTRSFDRFVVFRSRRRGRRSGCPGLGRGGSRVASGGGLR